MIGLAAITLSLQLQRSSFDLLDGVDIEVAVHNSSKVPAAVTFPKPAEYQIDIERAGTVLWSTNADAPPGTNYPPHQKQFSPGPTILVVYIWNGIVKDGTVPGPGDYTVRARLLGTNATQSASTTVRFALPTPVSALEKLKMGDVVTIAGHFNPVTGTVVDDTGSVALMRKLTFVPPDAVVAVRGYLTALPNGTHAFFVQRWAVMR
jgi:hypothetical protein